MNKANEEGRMTPGPWVVSECKDGIYAGLKCLVRTPGGSEIVGVRQLGYATVPEGHMEANARAIAALPELVEALRQQRAWLACNVFPEEVGHIEHLRAINAVLAKLAPEDGVRGTVRYCTVQGAVNKR